MVVRYLIITIIIIDLPAIEVLIKVTDGSARLALGAHDRFTLSVMSLFVSPGWFWLKGV